MSLEIKNLTKKFGEQTALNNINLDIHKNEIIGLLGPNGAGKSTLMKSIVGALKIEEGEIIFDGKNITENETEVKKNIGFLPENNPLYLEMYVKEFLEFVAKIYKVKNVSARVKEMIDLTGLQLEQNKKIGALSKGYRQRVGLAQAIIHDPKVLIMDEPTTGLDPNQLEEIRNLIKMLGKEKTVMLSTHIMQEVEAICDRVIIINKGEIVANEDTKTLQTGKSKQLITVEFDKEIAMAQLKLIPGIDKVIQVNKTSWQLITNSNDDVRKLIFDFAVQNNLSVLTLNREEKKIEDVFKDLTR